MLNHALIFPIILAVAANALYHIASKGIPAGQNAFMGLIVNYATALVASVTLFMMTPHNSVMNEVAKTNWACILMGISITGVEAGFVYIYRAGGEVSSVSLIVNILLALAMLAIGVSIYHESLTAQKIFGAILCLVGIVIMSI